MRTFHTLLRIIVGGLFAGHGAQKLFGWFGGPGIEGTGGFFESIGIKPGKQAATVAGASETGGGLLLAAGIATPLAGAALTGVMTQAMRSVHLEKGPWNSDGGWEFNVVMIAAVLAMVEEDAGLLWALAALAAGVAGPDLALQALGKVDADQPGQDAPIAAAA